MSHNNNNDNNVNISQNMSQNISHDMIKFIHSLDEHKNMNKMTHQDFFNVMAMANENYHYYYSFPNDDDLLKRKYKNSHKININVNVNSLNDLIYIIEHYQYNERDEYNIDLKALFNIKDELYQLNNMIGMTDLKTSIVQQLLYFIQNLHVITDDKRTSNINTEYKHTIICGPPGTGKTEIAKIIGKMYSKLGILSKNVFKKVTRQDLVAEYLGQTAIKTKNVIHECLGGVLFIDEAYSLGCMEGVNTDTFAKECIDTLCEALSDHKNDLMVIIAGYENELQHSLFRMNSGMESRFIWKFKIDDYSPKELYEIFIKKIKDVGWNYDENDFINVSWFEKNKTDLKNYGRDVELLVTYCKISHSTRIFGKSPNLRKIINNEDVKNGYEMFSKNKKQKNRNDVLLSLYV